MSNLFWPGISLAVVVGCAAIALGVANTRQFFSMGLIGVVIVGLCTLMVLGKVRQ